MKQTYVHCSNKKIVREFIIQFLAEKHFKHVIGLPGPDINFYINFFKKQGIKNMELYEIVPEIFHKQYSCIKTKKARVELKHADIIEAVPDMKNTLYDLDFCRSVKFMSEYIKKFKKNFIMTFSLRIGLQKTIDLFFNNREEIITNVKIVDSPIPYTVFSTDKNNKYLFIRYFDSSAMCCFAKI